nr:meiotic recombination protein REC8 homolog [Pogona vitticeps]
MKQEIQHILERLNRTQQQFRIDLTDLEQPGLLLPSQLELMEALEEAPDPFFGLMEPLLPSPSSIPHVRNILETPTPERSPTERAPSSMRRRTGEPLLTVSPDAITLREAEPITLPRFEEERDLPEITAQEIDMLAEQEGFLVPGVATPLLSPRKRRLEEEPAEEIREQEPSLALGLSPPPRIKEEPSAPKEAGLRLTGDVQLPGEVPLLPLLEATPPSEGPGLLRVPKGKLGCWSFEACTSLIKRVLLFLSLQLLLPEFEPSPARPRRRRRQLRFLDEITQISREDFQEQILNTQAQCQPLEMVLLPAKRQKMSADLLGNATYGWMHPTLHGLWARCANLQRVDYARRRALEERGQRVEEEAARRAEGPSELEELRAIEEPSLPPPGSSEISLETTEEEQRPSLVISEERAFLEPEEVILPVVPELPEISFELPPDKDTITLDYVRRAFLEPEEVILPVVPELPEISFELPPDKDTITLDYVRRMVSTKLEQVGEIEFVQLVPLTTPRAVVSRFFYMCLVLAGAQFVHLEQSEPYGRILLQPGARFPLS